MAYFGAVFFFGFVKVRGFCIFCKFWGEQCFPGICSQNILCPKFLPRTLLITYLPYTILSEFIYGEKIKTRLNVRALEARENFLGYVWKSGSFHYQKQRETNKGVAAYQREIRIPLRILAENFCYLP